MDRTEKIVLYLFSGCIVFALCAAIVYGSVLWFTQNRPVGEIGIAATTPAAALTVVSTIAPTQETCNFSEVKTISSSEGGYGGPQETRTTLENTSIPATNLISIAEKFQGKKEVPLALTTSPIAYQVGDQLYFWVLHIDSSNYLKVSAHLAYATKDVYFWVADGVAYTREQMKTFIETFDNKIYPTDQEFFGKEWIPGVDNDPHLYILYAPGLGGSVAGYTSGVDEVLPVAHPYANAHEMFAINSDIQTLSDPYTLAVAAHELQHLIHNYHDPNEESWLNEGFSELAVLLNGYRTGGFDSVFSFNPDLQLNEWPGETATLQAHYGASFLFTTYLLDRFGESVTKAVVDNPANGLDSIDAALQSQNVIDPLSTKLETADQLFQDWTLANYLQDSSLTDGRFNYHNYSNAPVFTDTEVIPNCSSIEESRTVHQYGTDYIRLGCAGNYQLEFEGNSEVKVLPIAPDEGDYFVWSNKADSSDMTMTHEFDFSQMTGKIELSFDMWYDLETSYDFLYLLGSVDGESWKIIQTPSCTKVDTTGNNYGCGYNGTTPTWKSETVDLSKFAGKKIWLRFEYVTDAAVTGEGFAIDQVSIPQIDYSANFENDNGGWDLSGFVRMNNRLPQTFLVSTIEKGSGQTRVQEYRVQPGEKLILNKNTECGSYDLVLVVSGSTRYSRQEASYRFRLIQK